MGNIGNWDWKTWRSHKVKLRANKGRGGSSQKRTDLYEWEKGGGGQKSSIFKVRNT